MNIEGMKELEVLANELTETRKHYREKAQKVLTEHLFPTFFGDHPEIKMIYWTQYTPYFNDGDECVFRINDVCVSDVTDHEETYESFLNEKSTWKLREALSEDVGILDEFFQDNEDILKEIYGNHVIVNIYNEDPIRTVVEEFDHD